MLQNSDSQLTNILQLLPQPAILLDGGAVIYRNPAAAALGVAEGADAASVLPLSPPADTDSHMIISLRGTSYQAAVHPLREGAFCVIAQPQQAQLPVNYLNVIAAQIRKPLDELFSAARRLLPELELMDRKTEQQASLIYRGLYQLQRLTWQLSDGGQLALEKGTLRPKRVELQAFFQQLADWAADMMDYLGIRLEFSGLPQLRFADIDAEKLSRAIWNLLANAIAHLAPGGTVELSVQIQASNLLICVANHGAADKQAPVFDFYAQHPGLTSANNGLGLGLAIVRQVAALHGGSAMICPQPDGGYSVTMSISLGRAPQELHSARKVPRIPSGRNPALVELANVLPLEAYHPLDIDG